MINGLSLDKSPTTLLIEYEYVAFVIFGADDNVGIFLIIHLKYSDEDNRYGGWYFVDDVPYPIYE